jgi:hypothetical protein
MEIINHYLKMPKFEVSKIIFPGTCKYIKQEGGLMYFLIPKQIIQKRRIHKLIKLI